jgi:WD40 repeat protein
MRRAFLAILLCAFCIPARAQNGCPPLQAPPPDPGIILSPRQEVEFGEIYAEQINSEYQVIEDESLTGYLTRVGTRVAAQLPDSGLHYRFFLYDNPEVQAFGIPGGRVYVSRKMVAFLRDENELASLLGHELGHLVAREQAAGVSRLFRNILGLKSLPENENLFDRYNQVVETSRLKKASPGSAKENDREQIVADQLGLQAVTRAGYSPSAFPDFMDRLLETKGNTGSWLTDIFGATKPSSKRLRELLKGQAALPPACLVHGPIEQADAFKSWQAAVLRYQGIGHAESIRGVSMRKFLNDPLRGDINSFRFSGDGKYLLAQDDGGIYVMTREPLKLIFRIDAPDAEEAQFTPDSRSVVFFSTSLRVEIWDIDRQAQTSVTDVPAMTGCRQSSLSPDAHFLACLQEDMSLLLFEVATGAKLMEKRKFFAFDTGMRNFNELFTFLYVATHREVITMRFSPDGRYFVASSRTGEDAAIDLQTKEKINVTGALHAAITHSFTFIRPDQIVGIDEHAPAKSRVVEFPSGKIIDHVPLGETTLFSTRNPKYVLVRPFLDHPVGILDLEKKRVIFTGRITALDIWEELGVSEKFNGEVGIFKIGEINAGWTLQLPLGKLGSLQAAVASSDLRWVGFSTRTRGAVWDTLTGERLLYVRGFQNASRAEGSSLLFDFPKLGKLERELTIINPQNRQSTRHPVKDDDDVRFFGSTTLRLKFGEKSRDKIQPVDVEAMDTAQMTPLWSHNFPKGGPGFGGSADSGKIVFAWNAAAAGLAEESLHDASLLNRLPRTHTGDTDYFFQIVDARSGKNSGSVFLPTGGYSFVPEYWKLAGDSLVIVDNQHRVLLYSVATGEAKQKWFGDRPQLSGDGKLLALENGQGHLRVFDLNTLLRMNEYYFAEPIATKTFSADGKRLLVLLSDQTVFQLDIDGGSAATAAN